MDYRLIGCKGCGSAITEAMLEWAGLAYTVEDLDFADLGPGNPRLQDLNPLGQVPTLILPDGTVMTESAAMTLHIGDRKPAAGLVPGVTEPGRDQFLNRLIWLVAAVYPTFTYGDRPVRWVTGEEPIRELRTRTDARRQDLWRYLESQLKPDPWFLGDRFSALDIFLFVMVRWRPRLAWFAAECPRIDSIAEAVAELPQLKRVWSRHFG